MPGNEASSEEHLTHRIFLIELLLLNQNHRWKHTASCFKKSLNSKGGCCRYNFPRLVQKFTEMDETGRLQESVELEASILIPSIQSLLQVFRSNHDVRFLLCCAHEMYYTIKYVVKDQNSLDNIAAVTIASYTRHLEKEITKKNMSANPNGLWTNCIIGIRSI